MPTAIPIQCVIHVPFGFPKIFDRIAFEWVAPHVFDDVAETEVLQFGQIDALEWPLLVMRGVVYRIICAHEVPPWLIWRMMLPQMVRISASSKPLARPR